MDSGQSTADSATRAFSELQVEVGQVLRSMSAIERAVVEKTVPDYSRDLAGILERLEDVGARLEAIEAKPAVKLTPGELESRIQARVENATAARERGLKESQTKLSWMIDTVERAFGTARTKKAQEGMLLKVGAIACVAGLLLGPFLWHQTIKRLPESWQVAEPFAAGLLDRPNWEEAGYRLIVSGNPEEWNQIAAGYGYAERYGESLAACETKAAKSGKETACKLTVTPPEKSD